MLPPKWKKNDRKAYIIIYSFSVFLFLAVFALSRVKLNVSLGFDVHLFAKLNALINSVVAVCLLTGLLAVKKRKYILHRQLMLTALILSVLFLVSYVCHHLLAGETKFGDLNHDAVLDETEKTLAGSRRIIYYVLLGTHIPLAALVLPFILFATYRAMTAEFERHKKLTRFTWPVWFYVAVSGVIVYFMISPYYT
ncbi:MAG: DUF420 domain-containing protein [Chitinophagaceae bacterium]|nr:DUF420 domain-containing protein [Chitinophagaceae bacterium]